MYVIPPSGLQLVDTCFVHGIYPDFSGELTVLSILGPSLLPEATSTPFSFPASFVGRLETYLGLQRSRLTGLRLPVIDAEDSHPMIVAAASTPRAAQQSPI